MNSDLESGRFGEFGGRYVSEMLMPNLLELSEAWQSARNSKDFQTQLEQEFRTYIGRATPLTHAIRGGRYTKKCGTDILGITHFALE